MEGYENKWIGCFLDDLRAFGINVDQWKAPAQDERYGAGRQNKGRNISWRNGTLQRKPAYARNVTGRTKERIAQSKRTRAGSLAVVD